MWTDKRHHNGKRVMAVSSAIAVQSKYERGFVSAALRKRKGKSGGMA